MSSVYSFQFHYTAARRKNTIEFVPLLLHIREVPSSNLDTEMHYSVFVICLSFHRKMMGQYVRLRHNRFLLHPFLIYCSVIILQLDAIVVSSVDSVVKH
jgi:hypothetical protein